MKQGFFILGVLLTASAHASVDQTTFTITRPTVAASDVQNMYTLTLAEGKAGFALNSQSETLSFTCGPANQSHTSLFAVMVNGEIRMMGRKKECRDSLERIAATPARFSMRITLTPAPDSRTSPGLEYTLDVSAQ